MAVESLSDVKKRFRLTTREASGLFAAWPPVAASALLQELLRFNMPLATAIGTEKARSEMLIAPVLLEVKRAFNTQISLFSGIDFSVDPAAGLVGICDFLLSRGGEQFYVEAPVLALVEAKNESIRDGIGQCAAELVAAQRFNEREENVIPVLYGVVTTGTNWKFLALEGKQLSIDLEEYSVAEVERILGILTGMLTSSAA